MDTRALDRFLRNRGAVFGLAIVLSIVVFSFGAPLFSAQSPYVPDFEHGRGPFGTPGSPSRAHWLGTDAIFRDLLVRLAYGGRLSLEVAFAATAIAVTIGTAVGIASGFYRGVRVRIDALLDVGAIASAATGACALAVAPDAGFRLIGLGAWLAIAGATLRLVVRGLALLARRALGVLDAVDGALGVAVLSLLVRRGFGALADHGVAIAVASVFAGSFAARARWDRARHRFPRIDVDDVAMRIVDVLLAFPFLLLLMALGAAVERTTVGTIFLVLGLTAWTGTARVIRGKTLQLRDLEFIVASRALGQSTPTILVRHVLPNVAGVAIVLATNSVAGMIVAEAALAFLGLSLPPPAASWGRMLDEGRHYFGMAPWLTLAPGLAILLAVLGFNLLGEGLRDAFDPKEARR